MMLGSIETTVIASYVALDKPYYSFKVLTKWDKSHGGTQWTTTVVDNQTGARVDDTSRFDFPLYAPLTGIDPHSSGHRAALEAHRQVCFLVMG